MIGTISNTPTFKGKIEVFKVQNGKETSVTPKTSITPPVTTSSDDDTVIKTTLDYFGNREPFKGKGATAYLNSMLSYFAMTNVDLDDNHNTVIKRTDDGKIYEINDYTRSARNNTGTKVVITDVNPA